MQEHLRSEDFERVIAGEAEPSDVRHVRECGACSAELAVLRTVLVGVKESAVRAADRQRLLGAVEATPAERWSGWLRGGMWAGAMAAVLLVAVVPVEMMRKVQPTAKAVAASQQVAASAELSDDALLNGVQSDLSSTVPTPLEPLAGTTTTTTGTSTTTSNAGDMKE
jgi:hypothetical protein